MHGRLLLEFQKEFNLIIIFGLYLVIPAIVFASITINVQVCMYGVVLINEPQFFSHPQNKSEDGSVLASSL